MKPSLLLLAGESHSPLLPLTAVLFAVAVFIVDTFTPLGIAVAVLYVVVVLMAGRFFERRGVLFVGFACLALTIVSYGLQHGDTYGPAFVRCLVSLAAIAITTFLALRIQAAGAILREQASLLDITYDAVFARDMNDVITFWNCGAEELYGWQSEEALGKISHELLHTVFPGPREEIRAELLRSDRWEGELTHTKRDGTEVVVASRWSIRRDRTGPAAILETNNDVTERKRAENALRKSEALSRRSAAAEPNRELGVGCRQPAQSPLVGWKRIAFSVSVLRPTRTPSSRRVIASIRRISRDLTVRWKRRAEKVRTSR